MKIINYDELLADHKPKGYFSDEANRLANILIHEYCIQKDNGLARFLDVDSCFDDHTALRVWVQKQLETQEDYITNELILELQSRLYQLIPQTDYR